ncbi:MAG: FadR/GntR family transcriptional regulator [Bacillota bacterium]|nr:FadR/GntR family transcriptional regulator [Bacillota bacterium]
MGNKQKLSDRIIQELLDRINVQKEYVVGSKLPSEPDLAAELGVSRTTLREAILYLVAQGVLEIRRGKGTYVADNSRVAENFKFDELNLMHHKLKDLYELRSMLEPEITYYAAARATDEELANIISLGKKIDENWNKNGENADGNKAFHVAIAKAAHNEFALKISEIINNALIDAFKEEGIKQTLYEDTMMDHQMIMHYLKMRDSDGARSAMSLHMKHSMNDYLKE